MASTAYIDPYRGERLSSSADDRVDAGELGSVLARRWLSILVWLVLALGASVAYLAWATPIYTASTSILLDPRGGTSLSAPETNAGRLSQDVNLIESQVRLVSSPAVLARVVETQRLVEDPEFNSPREPLLFRLRRLAGWEVPDMSAAPIERQVLAAFAERLDVKRSERTLVIDIEVSSRDPAKAARLADAVAAAFVEDQLAAKAQAAGREGNRLDARLRELEDTIRSDERKLEAFKASNPVLVGAGGELNEQQLLELNSALLRARATVTQTRARLDQVNTAARTGRLDTLPDSLRSGVIGTLRSQTADAQRRSEGLATNLGPRHPDFIEAQRQLQTIQGLIRDELRRIAAGMRAELDVVQASEAAAQRALAEKQREVAGANEARAELRRLERAVQTGRTAYDRLLTADTTLQQEGAPTPIARPLAPALLPLRPSSPDPRAILPIAAAFGLALGLAAALRREHRARVKAARRTARTRFQQGPAAVAAAPVPDRLDRAAIPAEAEAAPSESLAGAVGRSDSLRAQNEVPDQPAAAPESPVAPATPPPVREEAAVRRAHLDEAAAPSTHQAAAQDAPKPADEEPAPQVAAAPQEPIPSQSPESGPPERSVDLSASASRDGYVRRFHLGRGMRPAE